MIRHLMDVELARQQWDDGRRRVERAQPGLAESPRGSRRSISSWRAPPRVGQTFTLAELAGLYHDAGEWARDLLYDARADDAPPPDTATVTDAAFQLTPAARSTTARDAPADALRAPMLSLPSSSRRPRARTGARRQEPAAPARRRSCARSTRCPGRAGRSRRSMGDRSGCDRRGRRVPRRRATLLGSGVHRGTDRVS